MVRLLLSMILCFSFVDASIIKKPPVKIVDIAYKDLVCTEEDQANITEIISTVGGKPKLKLAFYISYLRELEAKITHVHPLKFLATIFKNPDLKAKMHSIWYDSYKRDEFFKGLSPRLTLEAEKGKLDMHLNDFALDLDVPAASLKPYFETRDWEGMVFSLIYPDGSY